MFELFFKPQSTPMLPSDVPASFFILPEDIPAYSEQGVYSSALLLLSYMIAVIAAYVALDIAGKIGIQRERSQNIKLVCGAFAMGAGVWAMHFVGMLAYKMDMLISYNPLITALSMIVAVIFSGAAFLIVAKQQFNTKMIAIAAPLMGLAICSMHYIGMSAMEMDGVILYTPVLFFTSFAIAVAASAAALYLMFKARESTSPVFFRVIAAMTMGFAVTGMHYTGMGASVILPFAECRYAPNQDYTGLAVSIALITLLVLAVAYLVRQLDDAIAQIQQRTAQLFQSQKMEAVGQLTGGIAHDFNNILAVVLGNLELLERQPALGPAAYGYIKAAESSVMKARGLTQRLLGFSRKQILHPETVNLNEALPSMLQFIERAVGANIFIRTMMSENLPKIYVDPLQLESALLNLALNARDALKTGGEITVTVEEVHIDIQLAQNLEISAGDYIAVHVKDRGHGMAPDVLARATEPFFTTKDVGKGSGMGLSMVYGFVRQSHGSISIESVDEIGTTVTLYLPTKQSMPATAPVKESKVSDEVTPGTGSILVVDDEKEIRTYMEIALGEIGYSARIAASGQEALDMFKAERPDLLITDVIMPGMTGYELAEKIQAFAPDTGMIFMSGYTPEAKMPAGKITKYSAFLSKPFTLGKLVQAIRQVQDQKKAA